MRTQLTALLALSALAVTGCGDNKKDEATPPSNGTFLDGGEGPTATVINGVDTSDPDAVITAYFDARNQPQNIETQCAFMDPAYVNHLIEWAEKGGLYDCADVLPEDPFTEENTDPIEVIDQRITEPAYNDDYYGGSVTHYRIKYRTTDDHTDEGSYEVVLIDTAEGWRIAGVDN